MVVVDVALELKVGGDVASGCLKRAVFLFMMGIVVLSLTQNCKFFY
jgi:hypothetical protein